MFYVHTYDDATGRYSVVDTSDWSEEWYSYDELMNFAYNNIAISGVQYKYSRILSVREMYDFILQINQVSSTGSSFALVTEEHNGKAFDVITLVSTRNTGVSNNFTAPSYLYRLPDSICAGTSFRSVFISDVIGDIGKYCFENCSELQFIKFSDSQSDIPEGCCRGCTKLTTVCLGTSIMHIHDNAFEGCSSDIVIRIPIGSSLVLSDDDCKRIGIQPTSVVYDCIFYSMHNKF